MSPLMFLETVPGNDDTLVDVLDGLQLQPHLRRAVQSFIGRNLKVVRCENHETRRDLMLGITAQSDAAWSFELQNLLVSRMGSAVMLQIDSSTSKASCAMGASNRTQ